jgi:DnaJ-class molecular chaperone
MGYSMIDPRTRNVTITMFQPFQVVNMECPNCDGTGFHYGLICEQCLGSGRIEVKISNDAYLPTHIEAKK